MAQYDEVRPRFQAGEKILAISRALGISRPTVRSFAYAQSFRERAVRRPVTIALDPYLDRLETRLAEGCDSVAELWRDIKERGYPGPIQQVHRWVPAARSRGANHTAPGRCPAARYDVNQPTVETKPVLASPRQLAWLLVRSPEALSDAETATLAWIVQDAEVRRLSHLLARLGNLVRSCRITRGKAPDDPPALLHSWMDEAGSCGALVVKTFAAGLRKDQAAIQAALTMPWSSGQAEGQINKLKLIKRQMYGRGNFDLLRSRVLLAA